MNRDTRPLPLERRTYGAWEFVGIWVITGAFNAGGWMTGSSVIALGLNVWQAMLTVIVGNILVGIICVLTGAPGAKWHIGFSILQKASRGMPRGAAGWMLVLGICTNIGGISTHIFSQSDFTRFARRPGDQFLSQLLFVPLSTVAVALIGILCTFCASQLFPETNGTLLWEPYRMLATVQTISTTPPRARVAVAFASLASVVAQFGISVAENALSNGTDLSALLPRYFNLRRGGYLTAVFDFVMQPWELMNGASNFLTVMGGYGVSLGSMTGVMFSDYYLVRQRRLLLTGLYDASSTSIYWYCLGSTGVPLWPGSPRPGYFSLAMFAACRIPRQNGFSVAQPQAVDDADYFDTFGLVNDSVSVLEGEAVSGNGSLAKDQAVLSSEEMNQAV
ncbi:hypothetical protein FVEG_14078 [Fusarium verticillioides 7600]|uniref:Uncharacterized protein n=1 Tax=Gibberella moniliformis (strain M3125 / FGSC 7600) TaxID=334819 RepID=W7NHS6_GIBM7|nr:hypothetical protein FVEG_14078 [Fusarium verticillioides 7600]EWG55977.1 hypothetical protein FVEG_14078 [Fusarium verticillioides 7600]